MFLQCPDYAILETCLTAPPATADARILFHSFYRFRASCEGSAPDGRLARGAGGVLSDVIGKRLGMRGRLAWLFFVQLTGAVLCVILGITPVETSLTNTIVVVCFFSFFIEVRHPPGFC